MKYPMGKLLSRMAKYVNPRMELNLAITIHTVTYYRTMYYMLYYLVACNISSVLHRVWCMLT